MKTNYLDGNENEQARLNRLCAGKTLAKIEFRGMNSDISLCFTDGSEVVISHLGGLEIKSEI